MSISRRKPSDPDGLYLSPPIFPFSLSICSMPLKAVVFSSSVVIVFQILGDCRDGGRRGN